MKKVKIGILLAVCLLVSAIWAGLTVPLSAKAATEGAYVYGADWFDRYGVAQYSEEGVTTHADGGYTKRLNADDITVHLDIEAFAETATLGTGDVWISFGFIDKRGQEPLVFATPAAGVYAYLRCHNGTLFFAGQVKSEAGAVTPLSDCDLGIAYADLETVSLQKTDSGHALLFNAVSIAIDAAVPENVYFALSTMGGTDGYTAHRVHISEIESIQAALPSSVPQLSLLDDWNDNYSVARQLYNGIEVSADGSYKTALTDDYIEIGLDVINFAAFEAGNETWMSFGFLSTANTVPNVFNPTVDGIYFYLKNNGGVLQLFGAAVSDSYKGAGQGEEARIRSIADGIDLGIAPSEMKTIVLEKAASGYRLKINGTAVAARPDWGLPQCKSSDFSADGKLYAGISMLGMVDGDGGAARKIVLHHIKTDPMQTVDNFDAQGPTIELNAPKKVRAGDVVTLEWSVRDNMTAVEDIKTTLTVERDAQPVTITDNRFVAEAGEYTVTITAVDQSDNLEQKSVSFTVTPPPAPTSPSPANVSYVTASRWSDSYFTSYQCPDGIFTYADGCYKAVLESDYIEFDLSVLRLADSTDPKTDNAWLSLGLLSNANTPPRTFFPPCRGLYLYMQNKGGSLVLFVHAVTGEEDALQTTSLFEGVELGINPTELRSVAFEYDEGYALILNGTRYVSAALEAIEKSDIAAADGAQYLGISMMGTYDGSDRDARAIKLHCVKTHPEQTPKPFEVKTGRETPNGPTGLGIDRLRWNDQYSVLRPSDDGCGLILFADSHLYTPLSPDAVAINFNILHFSDYREINSMFLFSFLNFQTPTQILSSPAGVHLGLRNCDGHLQYTLYTVSDEGVLHGSDWTDTAVAITDNVTIRLIWGEDGYRCYINAVELPKEYITADRADLSDDRGNMYLSIAVASPPSPQFTDEECREIDIRYIATGLTQAFDAENWSGDVAASDGKLTVDKAAAMTASVDTNYIGFTLDAKQALENGETVCVALGPERMTTAAVTGRTAVGLYLSVRKQGEEYEVQAVRIGADLAAVTLIDWTSIELEDLEKLHIAFRQAGQKYCAVVGNNRLMIDEAVPFSAVSTKDSRGYLGITAGNATVTLTEFDNLSDGKTLSTDLHAVELTTQPAPQGENLTALWIALGVVGGVALIGAAVLTVVLVRKKEKTHKHGKDTPQG